MTVFKGYIKVVRSMLPVILIYAAIFFGIAFAMQKSAVQTESGTYKMEGLNIGIVDQEESELSAALGTYLSQFHEIISLENDKSVLQENLFYGDVDYIINIPADFTKVCIDGDEKLNVTKVPGSYSGFYADQQLNSFLNNAKVYRAAGLSDEEIADAITQGERADVTLVSTEVREGTYPVYIYYFKYIPYLFISMFGYSIGNVLITMKRKDLQRRMRASAISLQRQSLESILAIFMIGLAVWVFTMATAIVMYGNELLTSGKMLYFVLNSVAMLFVAVGISYMIGALMDSTNALSGAVNVIGLGMSFLCGVFVDVSLLSSSVRNVSRFLPVYWYEHINELLGKYDVFSAEVQQTIWKSLGIQLVYAVALFSVGVIVIRMRRQEN